MRKPSKLKAVDPKAAEPAKPKVLIYGREGVGKTWASLDFPSVYYIDTEGGANRKHYTDKLKKSGGAYFGPEQGSTSFKDVNEQIQALATEKHSYKTIVIDSATKLFMTTRFEAAEKDGDDYGRDKKEANKPARRLMNWFEKVDMNIIIIAHEIPLWGLDNKGERTQIGVTYDAWDKIGYDLDLTMNIVKAGDRRLARVVKSRLEEFPESSAFDWSYQKFAELYGQEIIESQGKQLVLATPEQLTELQYLLSIVKLPEDLQAKWFKAAKVESFEEMDTAKIAGVISHIKTKFIPQTTLNGAAA